MKKELEAIENVKFVDKTILPEERATLLNDFNNRKFKVLVSTDFISRGIDFKNVLILIIIGKLCFTV